MKKIRIMKNLLLTAVSIITLTFSFAQDLTINIEGSTTDVSGTTLQAMPINGSTDDHKLYDLIINNNDTSDQNWLITRSIINETTGWSNYLCWGVNPGLGLCYPTSPDLVWSTAAETIPAGGSGKLSAYVNVTSTGSATYRYYVSTDGINFLDSVDVLIESVLGLENLPNISAYISPNPAKDFVNIKSSTSKQSKITLLDVLGNVVLKENMSSSKRLNISELKNGIYFLNIYSKNFKSTTKKLVVRH